MTSREEAGERLLTALQNPALYPHPVKTVRRLETHISWLLLTGRYAYKIKKPVNLGFLDFSTLDKRRFFCHEELRLNRRLAPQLYLEVTPITGTPPAPRLGGAGTPIEYAVRMKQFPDDALFEHRIQQNRVTPEDVDRLAETIARFHARIDQASAHDDHGRPDDIQTTVANNFRTILGLLSGRQETEPIEALRDWCIEEFERRRDTLQRRKARGFVRECHGDLHLGNIVVLDGKPTPFDCIEFNAAFRWIDVISEIAFIVMDLQSRGRSPLAWRLLNRYLEITGDYRGLSLLRYYLVYRAMVRATVDRIRLAQQPPDGAHSPLALEFRHYADLAHSYCEDARTARPLLILMHGLSGSGKSVVAQAVAERIGAIRLRSDVERKRLTGFDPRAHTASAIDSGIYTRRISERTYRHLRNTARLLLSLRLPVILDATFLKAADRAACRALARQSGAAFVILDLQAPVATLRERIVQRRKQGGDPSEAGLAVLERQIRGREPLDVSEAGDAISIDTQGNIPLDRIVEQISQHCNPTPRQ